MAEINGDITGFPVNGFRDAAVEGEQFTPDSIRSLWPYLVNIQGGASIADPFSVEAI